jgi:hypothetical protein
MTVKQLIDELRRFNPDLPVYLGDWNEVYEPDHELSEEMGDYPSVCPAVDRMKRGYRLVLPERVVIGDSPFKRSV